MNNILRDVVSVIGEPESLNLVLDNAYRYMTEEYDNISACLETVSTEKTALKERGLLIPALHERANTVMREASAILSHFEIMQNIAGHEIRMRLMNPTDKNAKPPTMIVLEKSVEVAVEVNAWASKIIPMQLLVDRYAGLIRSLDWLQSQIKTWASVEA